jgi:hypothetical protein
MTQSTLRFLIGGVLTVGLLASLARGDDMKKPELLPPPKAATCEKAADCCSQDAACCQENGACCGKCPQLQFVHPGTQTDLDFVRPWAWNVGPQTCGQIMRVGAGSSPNCLPILQVEELTPVIADSANIAKDQSFHVALSRSS